MLHCIALLFLSLLFGQGHQTMPVDVLDVTKSKVTSIDIGDIGLNIPAGVTGVIGRPLPTPAVSLEIIMNQQTYDIGEEFDYQVVVKNISGKKLTIPWETDGAAIFSDREHPPAGFMYGFISVKMVSDNENEISLTEINLYGSEEWPSSLKTLNPEEFVVIKSRGRWNKDKIKSIQIGEREEDIEVYARWRFMYGFDIKAYTFSAKSESIPIRLIRTEKLD